MRTLRAALAVGATAVMVTAGLLVGLGSPAGAVELVANPGFESGTAGWTCTAETGIGTPAHAGAAALVGTPTGTTAECGQTIPVTAGAAYTLTAWVRGAFVFLGASGTAAGEVSIWTAGTNGAYEQLTVRFTGGSTPVRIWVHGWYAQGTYQADDVSLQGHRAATAASADDRAAHHHAADQPAADQPAAPAADEPARHRGAAQADPDRLLAQLRQRLVRPAAA